MSDKVDYFSARATVMHIKSENIAYPACPTCSKKVFETMGEGWRCEKCDRSFEKPEYRYIINMAAADWSGQAWFAGFNDLGEAVFHRSANELIELKNNDEGSFNKVVEEAMCQTFNFSCRAKTDTYNDTTRVRYGVQKIAPLDFKEECHHLMSQLSSSWAI